MKKFIHNYRRVPIVSIEHSGSTFLIGERCYFRVFYSRILLGIYAGDSAKILFPGSHISLSHYFLLTSSKKRPFLSNLSPMMAWIWKCIRSSITLQWRAGSAKRASVLYSFSQQIWNTLCIFQTFGISKQYATLCSRMLKCSTNFGPSFLTFYADWPFCLKFTVESIS